MLDFKPKITEEWKIIIDFTKIKNGGVDIKKVLSHI